MNDMNNNLHNLVFDFVMKFRESNPGFYCALRQKNTNERLDKGFWFQGNEDYVFLGLYDKGGGSNMTRSFGLVFSDNGGKIRCYIENVFNEEKDSQTLSCYQQMRDLLGGFEKEKETRYKKHLTEDKGFEFATDFLLNEKPKLDKLIEQMGCDDFFYTKEKFEKHLTRILKIQNLKKDDMLSKSMVDIMENKSKIPLNQILYGPPGTGKTYNTINKAISIINPSFDLSQDRAIIKEEFNRLVQDGSIRFITFHQSFSYEDFVEGIKPMTITIDNEDGKETKNVVYEIEDGVFKQLCEKSIEHRQGEQLKEKKLIDLSEGEFDRANFYKLSLGDTTNRDDNGIYEYCVENSCIAIGFGGMIDFSDKTIVEISKINEEKGFTTYSPIALNYFIHHANIGDYVLISKGNRYVRAMAKLVGNYYYDENSPIEYKHFRKVEWIFTDEEMPIRELYGSSLSQMTIYKFDKKKLTKEFFVPQKEVLVTPQPNNYVLIIDEINRGNIASIFGELITLIEEDKREGGGEALSTILPYSKEKFSVPSNVYILGTMNTADRSVEALDIALRRRFSFIEMAPNSSKIENEIVGDVNLRSLLDIINLRIEKLLDKDHRIGHAYFMNVKSLDELINVFADKVIPLLEEYFFGDYSKIGLVLGRSFVQRAEFDSGFSFADFENDDQSDLLDKPIYELTDWENWDFNSIL